jgi:hypothetical protein
VEAFIRLAYLLECCFEEGLVFVFLSRTQACQPIQADIDANGCWPLHRGDLRNLHLHGNEPPIAGFGDTRACDFPFETKILGQIDPSKFRYPYRVILEFHLIIGQIK